MGRIRRPRLPPGPLADLLRELHDLHARAGWPSTRQLARGQPFSHTAVHDLFTTITTEPPRLPVLHRVVEQLARIAPRMDVEDVLDRFDGLWLAVDRDRLSDPSDGSRPGSGRGGSGIIAPLDDLVLARNGPREPAAELAGALFGGRLVMMFQPIVGWDGTIVCVEMVMRWQHPAQGLMAPSEFLPTADEAGLMRHLDMWALDAATEEAVRWAQESEQAPALAVNVGELLPGDSSSRAVVVDIVERSGLSWDRVVFELDANCFTRSSTESVESLTELTDRGARIALDDLGADFSTLALLTSAPVRTVNLSRGLVATMSRSPAAAAVVRAIIDISHSAGCTAIAEGVEDAAQLELARDLGADAFQGYLISRPVPAETLREVVRRGGFPVLDSLLGSST